MKNGFIYWHPIIYRNTMHFLYGKNFYSRYETIAGLLPDHASVVDVCCGDCYINNFLSKKNITYLGMDLNLAFVRYALKKEIKAKLFNCLESAIPQADYIIIQGSLYQFIPNHRLIIDKLFSAARKAVIISEPIMNIATNKNLVISFLANLATRVEGNDFRYRFTKTDLLDLFREYNVSFIQEIKGGRDYIGFFLKDN